MRTRILSAALIVAAALLAATAQTRDAQRELERVAAFARLYGVVRFFYPADAAAALDWNRFAVYGVSRVRRAADTKELERALTNLTMPLGPGIQIAPDLPPVPADGAADVSLVAWRYFGPGISTFDGRSPYRRQRTNRPADNPNAEFPGIDRMPARLHARADIDLGSGLRARVPLALSDAEAVTNDDRRPALQALQAELAGVTEPSDAASPDVRLADVVVAWNVFRHFYPYGSEAAVDWDATLTRHLGLADAATTRGAHRDVLRRLVADARDGHGGVNDAARAAIQWLPVQLGVIGGDVVVTATTSTSTPAGAVVTEIDGKPAKARVAESMALASGTDQWKRTRALRELSICSTGATATLLLDAGSGPRPVTLSCAAGPPVAEKRPAPVTELSLGIWYVDLTRARMADISPSLTALSDTTGVVFDVRGYPTDAGAGILPHLLDAPETDRWMHVARITGPFGQVDGWESFGWNLKPVAPRIGGTIVFLTDGRAISYAESVMGYVGDRNLATIIGAPTAGTNGNVTTFTVPSGFVIAFTGMRVTRHDGHTQFHLAGVTPHIAVEPTIEGLRTGRDDVLERALAHIRARRGGR